VKELEVGSSSGIRVIPIGATFSLQEVSTEKELLCLDILWTAFGEHCHLNILLNPKRNWAENVTLLFMIRYPGGTAHEKFLPFRWHLNKVRLNFC